MKRFKLIFFMSLILILILGTSSQASVSDDYMNYIWTNLENNSDFNKTGNYNTNFKSYLQRLTSEQKNSVKTKINQYLSSNNLNYEDINLNVFLIDDSEVTFHIYFVFSNNTAPNNNDLGYLELKRNNINDTRLYVKNNNSIIKFLDVKVTNYNNSFRFTVYDLHNLGSNGLIINLGKTAYSENTEIFYSSNISCYKLTQVAYIGYPISSSSNEKTRFLRNYSAYLNLGDGAYIPQEPDKPDEPSGDIPDKPSGDNTGTTIDLSNIENGIGNINNSINEQGQNIINNQNQNTDKIIANQNQNNQQVTDRLDDINSYDKNAIDSVVQGYLSGDYNASSSILALNDAFFHSSDDGDLVIEWDGINYLGVSLIPQGSFNFTEFVSSDEQITKIYNYYRMFATASFGIILIAAYYNLALSVLGLGSYFAMNTDTEEESTSDLGNSSPQLESTEEYYTRKFKHESNMRYNKRG